MSTTSLCHSCPKLCRHACPVAWADQNEQTTPWGKMSAMLLADRGELPFNSETASLAYKCLTCHASTGACEMGNPVPETLLIYRTKAFQQGVAPTSVQQFAQGFQRFNNPYPQDLQGGLRRLFPEEFKRPNGKVVYLPGCTEIQFSPKTIRRTLDLFRQNGTSLELYREPIQCCGYPLYAAGDLENFRELAEVNFQALKNYREVWSASPICLNTFKTVYSLHGLRLSAKFVHVAEKLVALLKTPYHRVTRVAYHDPCYLGRYLGIYEEPREVIERITGKAPLEFSRSREGSFCCGAGGLLPISSPETAEKITRERLNEYRRTGATCLVSGCPTCVRRFQEVDDKLEVRGLVDFVYENTRYR